MTNARRAAAALQSGIYWGICNREWRTKRQQQHEALSDPGCVAIRVCILGGNGSLRGISTVCERRYLCAGRVAAQPQLRDDRFRRRGCDGFFCHFGFLHSSSIPKREGFARRAILRSTLCANPDPGSGGDRNLPVFGESPASVWPEVHNVEFGVVELDV